MFVGLGIEGGLPDFSLQGNVLYFLNTIRLSAYNSCYLVPADNRGEFHGQFFY